MKAEEKHNEVDFTKVTSNLQVIELIKMRDEIEDAIKEIDEMALVNYELQLLSIGRK